MCLDCYFMLNSPTKINDRPWIFLPAPRKYTSSAEPLTNMFFENSNEVRKIETEIKEKIVKNIVKRNYSLDEDSLRFGDISFPFTIKGIDELAKISGMVVGKWLIYRNESEIDALWTKIGKAVLKGKLGISAKVSTNYSKSKRYIICVYTYNYFDVEDIEKVRNELSLFGVDETLCYKPDIYTYLNIYSGKFKLSPCRYRK